MLAAISRFCSRFPYLIFAVVAVITVFLVYQIKENAYFEADMTKFMLDKGRDICVFYVIVSYRLILGDPKAAETEAEEWLRDTFDEFGNLI